MKSLLSILPLLLASYLLSSQAKWSYFSSDNWVQDIKVIDEHIFVGNPTGLYVFDIGSENGTLFQSVNSDLRGSHIWEMLVDGDDLWLSLIHI